MPMTNAQRDAYAEDLSKDIRFELGQRMLDHEMGRPNSGFSSDIKAVCDNVIKDWLDENVPIILALG